MEYKEKKYVRDAENDTKTWFLKVSRYASSRLDLITAFDTLASFPLRPR